MIAWLCDVITDFVSLISYPQIMHWKVEFSAGYFQNVNVDGATVSNKGIKTTQPSLSLSAQERAVIQQKF